MCYQILDDGEPVSEGFYMSVESARKALQTFEKYNPEKDYTVGPA